MNEIIKNDITQNRCASSYLFIGPKQTCLDQALIMAKMINCVSADKAGFCGTCAVCKRIDEQNYPDLMVLQAKGRGNFIKIEDIKEIQDIIQVTSIEAKKRMCVVLNVERLDIDAANSFLKTLEEPPDHTLFILTTTSLHRVLDTIVSRCRRIFLGEQELDFEGFDDQEFIEQARTNIIDYILCKGKAEDQILEMIDQMHNDIKKRGERIKQYSELLLEITESAIRDLIVLQNANIDKKIILNKDKIDIMNNIAFSYHFEILEELLNKVIKAKQLLNFNLNFKLMFTEIFV